MRTSEAEPCWLIRHADGEPWPQDPWPGICYTTQEYAEKALAEAIAGLEPDERPARGLHLERAAEPCVVLSCDACGYRWDEDEDGVTHLDRTDRDMPAGWTTDGLLDHCGGDGEGCTPLDNRAPGPLDVPLFGECVEEVRP